MASTRALLVRAEEKCIPGEIVYDPFLGSGTTLIAAEQTGRICYGCELDPKYVDVVVKRQSFTGKEADGDGRSFDQIARCHREIAVIEDQLRAGHSDVEAVGVGSGEAGHVSQWRQ